MSYSLKSLSSKKSYAFKENALESETLNSNSDSTNYGVILGKSLHFIFWQNGNPLIPSSWTLNSFSSALGFLYQHLIKEIHPWSQSFQVKFSESCFLVLAYSLLPACLGHHFLSCSPLTLSPAEFPFAPHVKLWQLLKWPWHLKYQPVTFSRCLFGKGPVRHAY